MGLQLRGIHKSFSGIQALSNVDLSVAGGEIVGLVGGNGAGKSTLMKVAAAIHSADRGTVSINGVTPKSPANAIALGVSLVRQELVQAEDLDVASNVLLGHEPGRFGFLHQAALYRRAEAVLQRVGGDRSESTAKGSVSRTEAARGSCSRALPRC